MDIDDFMAEPLTPALPDTQNADNLTQDIVTTQKTPTIWGMMFPLKNTLPNLKLEKDVYTLGRLVDCDICITAKHFVQRVLNVVSKIHLRIYKEEENDGSVVYLEDLSSNGTYVNDKLVGKGNKVILDSNDVIALSRTDLLVYTFISNMVNTGDELPVELRMKYAVSRQLGKGAFGEVKLVFTKDIRCKRFAMKLISKKSISKSSEPMAVTSDKIMNEAKILKALQHPYIIRVEEIIDSPSTLYIILELMEGGELFDRIHDHPDGLSEQCSKVIMYQIVLAVAYLHKNGITHRDLKPENILLASKDEFPLVKVSDFGLSKWVNAESKMTTFCGTMMYVAPEILKTGGRETYTKQVDVWSLGVILYVCLSNRTPFIIANPRHPVQDQILRGLYKFPPDSFSDKTSQSRDLIKRMMTVDPNKRITIDEVLLHRWLQDRKMRAIVDELTHVPNLQNRDANSDSIMTTNSNNKHVLGPPANVAKRPRRH